MQLKDRYFGGRDVDGEVGIEIELEGRNLVPQFEISRATENVWSGYHDGSLRGRENIEVVLSKPIPRDEVNHALKSAQKMFDDYGSTLEPSVRTGVHVHINVRHMTTEQVFIMMLMWFLFEKPLVRYCGEERVGNLFCLRGGDAEAYFEKLERAVREDDIEVLYTDELRYSAMNPKALREYGSLEFRCLKTPDNLIQIGEWVELLLKLKDYSLTVEDPRKLLEDISIKGGNIIAEECFGPYRKLLPAEEWTRELYDGLRLAQPIVFARDWNNPEMDAILIKTELPVDKAAAKAAGILSAREVIDLELE